MRISVLGMGNMGRAVAGRLLDHDHRVTVWNRSPGKAGGLTARGALEVATPAEALAGTDAAVLLVRDDDAVREVLGGLDGGGTGTLVCNCTTVSPGLTAELAARLPSFVAAPILGAPQAVEAGHATYVVAGPLAATERLEAMWPALTDTVIRVGEAPERAAVVKVVSNHLLLTGLVALSEAVGVAQAAGIDDELLSGLLSSSPLVAPGLRNRLELLLGGDHDGWFAMPLGAKDLGLFVELGRAHGVDPELAGRARDRFLEAVGAGWEEADVAGVVELLRGPTA
jgi:3-hydroxyisobutyrate dehydrogenase-like beta-hydroxyacid dehydrogenase